MAKKTINQALKDLFLGLGGDPSKLSDNTSVSDYIEDLESAIEAAATAELPTPAEANVGKVATVVSDGEDGYEWSAESVVIPQELPTPASTNLGKVATVVSDGAGGYEWGAETPSGLPSVTASDNGKIIQVDNGAWTSQDLKTRQATLNMFGSAPSFIFPDGMTRADFLTAHNTSLLAVFSSNDWTKNFAGTLFNKSYVQHDNTRNMPALLIFTGIMREVNSDTLYQVTITIGETDASDKVEYKAFSPTT